MYVDYDSCTHHTDSHLYSDPPKKYIYENINYVVNLSPTLS